MPQIIQLNYGVEKIAFQCPETARVLNTSEPQTGMDQGRFRKGLHQFLDSAGLDLSRPAVVVADKTRLCGYPIYLPVLIDVLKTHGARMGNLKIYIAYGTHARQTESESRAAYGDAYDQFHWEHHNCDDADRFVALGKTQRGTPVLVRNDVRDASCLITFGAVSHHYFAGYGGGRKLMFPGLGERKAIYANHSLFLDGRRRRLAQGCRPGLLSGNPLAEDLAEYEAYLPAHMAVHAVLDSHGRVCDLVVGQGRDHFYSACAQHAASCEIDEGVYDMVLASCGGFPKDINFIQSHKAVHNAAAFVRDGGHLIVLTGCADGIGSDTFMPWFDLGGWDAAFDRLVRQYVGNGGTALAMMQKVQRIKISLVTELDASSAGRIGVDRLTSSQVQECIDAQQGTLAVIPNASLLVRKP